MKVLLLAPHMVSQRFAVIGLLSLIVVPYALLAACDKVPLLAPTGTAISLIPVTTTVSLNSEVTIIATVIENGAATAGTGTGGGTTTRTGAGTPVQNGTLISFTTTLGRIEPSEARTHNGQVSVKLISGGASGTATITAFSGGASSTTQLKIGTAAVKTVLLTTTPQALGAAGGTVQVVATVTDDGGSPLAGVPVTFATDKGSVSPSTATTDASGNATATLTTNATAKVTATAGTVSSTAATVTVNARSLGAFSVSPSSTTAGTPVTFTVTPAAGANVSNVRVDFGDGSSQNLGAISAAQTVPHAYSASGTYTATATASDASGDAGALTTTVIVGSLPVTLTGPATTTVNTPVTFTVGGTAGTQVDHYEWTLSDGTAPFPTTAPQMTHTFTTRGAKIVRVDVIGVGGGLLGTATTGTSVN
jgi:hypothetical protein